MANTNIIAEYLISLGVDKKSIDNLKQQLKDVDKNINVIKWIDLSKALLEVGKAVFEVAKAFEGFIEKTVKADMQVQIFARRMLTTVSNARSLKSVMDAMGLKNLDELRDVALNPTLRAQFIGLRQLTQGLEPNAQIKSGIGNFRDVGYQLQRIQVILSYFSTYVIGVLGEMLKGPLEQLAKFLSNFASQFKNKITAWATQIATVLGYIWRFFQVFGESFSMIFKMLGDWKLQYWLRIFADALLAILFLGRDMIKLISDGLQWIKDRFPNPLKSPAKRALISSAIEGTGDFLAPYTAGLSIPIGGYISSLALGIGSQGNDGLKNTQELKSLAGNNAGNNVLQRLTLAQAVVESGWGKYAPGNNFFGIKGTGPAGSQLLRTQEEDGHGHRYWMKAWFRKYHNAAESFADHLEFLMKNKRYKSVLAAKTYEEAVWALQRAHYASDSNYAKSLISADRQLHGNTNVTIHVHEAKDAKYTMHLAGRMLSNILPTRNLQPITT
jgi:hypothetical protein